MNETKFRAYDKFDGMLYSNKNLLIIPSAFNPLDFSYNHYGRITFYKDKKGYIQSNITGHGGVLMQYTGLHDCKRTKKYPKGQEIYVGDIYKWLGYEVDMGKQLRPKRIKEVTGGIVNLYEIKNIIEGNGTLEIIGNIYENNNLTKQEDAR